MATKDGRSGRDGDRDCHDRRSSSESIASHHVFLRALPPRIHSIVPPFVLPVPFQTLLRSKSSSVQVAKIFQKNILNGYNRPQGVADDMILLVSDLLQRLPIRKRTSHGVGFRLAVHEGEFTKPERKR